MDRYELRRLDYSLSEDHDDLQTAYRQFFKTHCPIETVRAAEESGFDKSLWERLCAMGATTMALPDIVGGDGATHQGFYDLAYLRALPNIAIMAPKDENELRHMLRTAVEYPGPSALRFPRGQGLGVPLDPDIKAIPLGEAELLRDGDDVAVLVYGTLAGEALEAAAELSSQGISVAVLNARFLKPLDRERVVHLARRCRAIVTVEEASRAGGFGATVLEVLAEEGVSTPTRCLGIPDRLVEHGDPKQIRREFDLDRDGIAKAVRSLLAADGGHTPSSG
ncbi:MAG: acyl-CoA dehydrogenase family protein [Myxococcales bacterium]|nr:acyl-CoA dehydrogenase family protein [Myxococcales bacterium]